MSKLDEEWIELNEKLVELHEQADKYDNSPWRLTGIHAEIDKITREIARLEIIMEKRTE